MKFIEILCVDIEVANDFLMWCS